MQVHFRNDFEGRKKHVLEKRINMLLLSNTITNLTVTVLFLILCKIQTQIYFLLPWRSFKRNHKKLYPEKTLNVPVVRSFLFEALVGHTTQLPTCWQYFFRRAFFDKISCVHSLIRYCFSMMLRQTKTNTSIVLKVFSENV